MAKGQGFEMQKNSVVEWQSEKWDTEQGFKKQDTEYHHLECKRKNILKLRNQERNTIWIATEDNFFGGKKKKRKEREEKTRKERGTSSNHLLISKRR